jgi:hypothetical protein
MQGKDQEFTALARFWSFTPFIGIVTNLDWQLPYFIRCLCLDSNRHEVLVEMLTGYKEYKFNTLAAQHSILLSCASLLSL